jgi:Xaa-Pro aminopeptidase
MKKILLSLCIAVLANFIYAQSALDEILPVRERSAFIDKVLEYRIDSLLPDLMDREGLDMWIVISREYNEDPVMETMLPSQWLSARRRTILVFSRNSDGSMDKIAIARYNVGKLLQGEWNIDVFPDQWDALVEIINTRDPKSIGMNFSEDFGLADGLVYSEQKAFMEKLPEKYHNRVVSAERLAIAWLETRSKIEIEIYPTICAMGHEILQEAFSAEQITPGVTTTDDVIWWLRQRVVELGLKTWFHPSVSIQRTNMGDNAFLRSFANRAEDEVIQKGDLLHVDFGITYLRLNTDQQQHFYMLRDGETEVPKGLAEAFKNGNKLQDILVKNFESGKSGNEILKGALEEAKGQGFQASIYTHPIGFHGHAAGPTIGLWDSQGGVAGKGDYPLFKNTCYSIELFAATEVDEWGKIVRIMLEEDGLYDENGFRFLDGRAEEIYPIPRNR